MPILQVVEEGYPLKLSVNQKEKAVRIGTDLSTVTKGLEHWASQEDETDSKREEIASVFIPKLLLCRDELVVFAEGGQNLATTPCEERSAALTDLLMAQETLINCGNKIVDGGRPYMREVVYASGLVSLVSDTIGPWYGLTPVHQTLARAQ